MNFYSFLSVLFYFGLFADAFVRNPVDQPTLLRRSRRDLIGWNRQANRSRSLSRNRLGGNAAIPSLVDQMQNFYRQNSHLLPTGNNSNAPELLRLLQAQDDSSLLTDEERQFLAAFIAAHFM